MAVADLLIAIEANISQASAQINALKGELDSVANPPTPPTVGEQLATSLEAARPAGIALAAVGASITAAFALSVSTAQEFEAQMSGVRAVMTPEDAEVFGDALRELALIMGKETAFSAVQAGAAIEELIKAGLPAPAVLDGVGRAALDLAAATGIDVVTAATVAANAMNAFRVEVEEVPAVMDWLAGTANASAADIDDLRMALAQSSAVASAFGVSIYDTATAIGIFSDNGLRGSDAGTSLKTMLLRLIPATTDSYDAMAALGLITEDGANAFFTAEGSMRSLSEVAGILQGALSGMTEEQRLAALQTIFGTDAIRAAAIMAREGAEGFDSLSASISQMTVAEMASIRLDNLDGSVKILKGSVETAQIEIGDRFAPAIRSLADALTGATNAFLELDPGVQDFVIYTAAAAAVVTTLVGGFVLLYPLLSGIAAGFGALGTAAGLLTTLLAPVAVPALAVAAALGVLYLAWTNDWGGIQGIVNDVWTNVQPILQALGDYLGGRLRDASDALGNIWANVLQPAFTNVANAAGNLATIVGSWLQPVLQSVGNWVGDVLMPYFASLGNVISAVLNVAMTALAGLVQNVLLPALQSLGTFVANTLGPVITWLVDNAFRPLWEMVANNVGPVLQWLYDNAIKPLGDMFGTLSGFIRDVTGFFNDFANALRNIQLPWFLTPGSPTPFELALQGILDVVRLLVSAGNPLAWLETLGDWLGGAWSAIWGGDGSGGTVTGGGSITVYGPLVQIAGNADADEVVGALVAAFDILWTGADNTEGYQPGGNWS